VELLGGDVVPLPKRRGEPECTWADIAKIRGDLSWSPQVSFEEGVGRILADIDYWREAPLWDPASIAEATKTWFQYLGSR
jgi:UDP-glucose 4-epimerase